jgi:hypothetical protein
MLAQLIPEKRKRKLQAPSFKQQAMLDNGSGIM